MLKVKATDSSLAYVGDDDPCGSYVLRINLRKRLSIRFGQFKQGKLIDVEPGEFVYVGSAMARRGATCLARRLVRHATRTRHSLPHAIRERMLDEFPGVGLFDGELHAPESKTLRWNVDHLLDKPEAELVAAFVVRCPVPLEHDIGDLMEADLHTVVFEKGLGANDRPGSTYLLRVEADETWWDELPARLASLREEAMCAAT